MKFSSFLYFAAFGVKTILFRKKDPILGTIILTDRCFRVTQATQSLFSTEFSY